MEGLSDLFQKYLHRLDHIPEDVRYIPDDGLCGECDRLYKNHPGVNRVLAARGYQYYDTDTGKLVIKVGIPYCRCGELAQERASAQMTEDLKRIQKSNLPQSVPGSYPRSFLDATFENFHTVAGTDEAVSAALDFTVGTTPPILLLVGGTGTGKTHLLEAIGRQYLYQGHTVRYELVAHLLNKLRESIRISAEESVLQPSYDADILLLDDIGLEKPSVWVVEQLTALIDHRYRNGYLLVVATNETHEVLTDNLGQRLASRLFDTTSGKTMQVYLTAEDYRARSSTKNI